MATMLERALEIAREAHAGQVDKAGRPYIEHVLRVVDAVEGEDAKVVAALHDVLEDRPGCPMVYIDDCGIPARLVGFVRDVTRDHREIYTAYIARVGRSPCARIVKIADLRDHLHPDRIGVLTPSHAERYRRALVQLGATEGGVDGRE